LPPTDNLRREEAKPTELSPPMAGKLQKSARLEFENVVFLAP
jgi:hypothetical protein